MSVEHFELGVIAPKMKMPLFVPRHLIFVKGVVEREASTKVWLDIGSRTLNKSWSARMNAKEEVSTDGY
jgi:hypothetical protein